MNIKVTKREIYFNEMIMIMIIMMKIIVIIIIYN
jgi:hypothetical protein